MLVISLVRNLIRDHFGNQLPKIISLASNTPQVKKMKGPENMELRSARQMGRTQEWTAAQRYRVGVGRESRQC